MIARKQIAALVGLAILSALLAGCTGTIDGVGVPMPSSQQIVADILKMDGPSDAPASAKVDHYTYNWPVPKDAEPEMVGNVEVYRNVYPDTSIVVRPMRRGPQTFMYITSPQAKSDFTFEFLYQMYLKFQKAEDGSVRGYDPQSKLTVPILHVPWARSVVDNESAKTSYSVDGFKVTQHVNLRWIKFPLIADPEFDDPLKQIEEGRVMKAAMDKDGPATTIPGGFGKYYHGPNGLEIRLSNKASLAVLTSAGIYGGTKEVLSKTGNDLLQLLQKVVKLKELPNYMKAAGIGGAVYADYLFGNVCIGITLKFSREAAIRNFIARMYGFYYLTPYLPDDDRIWIERCDQSQPLIRLADRPASRHANIEQANDTAPATKAQPIAPPTDKTQPPTKAAPPGQSRPKSTQPAPVPGPTYYHVSMDDACRLEYPGSGVHSSAKDSADKNSWVCIDNSSHELGPADLDRYCNTYFPGSKAVPINSSASGWRCKSS